MIGKLSQIEPTAVKQSVDYAKSQLQEAIIKQN